MGGVSWYTAATYPIRGSGWDNHDTRYAAQFATADGTMSVDAVERELEYARREYKMHVDVGLWGGVLPETVNDQ